MRPIVREAWAQTVKELMAQRVPQFEVDPQPYKSESRHNLKYRRVVRADLTCFIVFRYLDSESFDISVGWSDRERYKFEATIGFDAVVWNFDLPENWAFTINVARRHGSAHWNFWEAPEDLSHDYPKFKALFIETFSKTPTKEEALALVRPATEEGVTELINFGLSYLEQKIAHVRAKDV